MASPSRGWGNPICRRQAKGVTLDTALGGLMATCGFDHVRQPETHEGINYPLHGSMCLHAVDAVDVAPRDIDEPFRLSASMLRMGANGARYRFYRSIEIAQEIPRITIDDTVETEPGHPIMALYHVNLGHPLIAPDTQVRGFDVAALPRAASVTECFDARDAAEQIVVQRDTDRHRIKLALSFEKSNLPYLQIHTRVTPGSNLLCIEPVTHDRRPRAQIVPGKAQPLCKRFRLAIDLSVEPVVL